MGNFLAKWWFKNGLLLYKSNRREEAVHQWKRHVIRMHTSFYKFLTYNYLAMISFNCGNFRDYLIYASHEQVVAEKLNCSRLICRAFFQMANANCMLGEYFRSIVYCREALRHEFRGLEIEARIYLIMGDVYYRLGYFQQSVLCWNKALNKSQEEDNVDVESDILTSIGKLYLDFGDTLGALSIFKQAYVLTSRSDRSNSRDILKSSQQATLQYAAILQTLGYSCQSILLIDSIMKEASSDGNRWLCALVMIQKASTLMGHVRDEDVHTVCKISLAMLKESGDKYSQINANLIIAHILTELPSLVNNNSFEIHLRDAFELANATGDKVSQFVCHRTCVDVFERRGCFQQSKWHQDQAEILAVGMDMQCPICESVFGTTHDAIEILPCNHIFHTRCIKIDLENSRRTMQQCRKCTKLYAYNEGFLSLKL